MENCRKTGQVVPGQYLVEKLIAASASGPNLCVTKVPLIVQTVVLLLLSVTKAHKLPKLPFPCYNDLAMGFRHPMWWENHHEFVKIGRDSVVDQSQQRFSGGSKSAEIQWWIRVSKDSVVDQSQQRFSGGSESAVIQWWIRVSKDSAVDQSQQ